MGALAVVKRRNPRLNNAGRPVVSATIAPALKLMRLIHMPVAKLSGFILIKPKMHAERNLAVLQHVGEIQISGCLVRWIAAKDD